MSDVWEVLIVAKRFSEVDMVGGWVLFVVEVVPTLV